MPLSPPMLPETAPFSPEQRNWLNGYLAGLQNLVSGSFSIPKGSGAGPVGVTTRDTPTGPVVSAIILYGSQSGNAEGLAHSLGDNLGKYGRISARVHSMEAFRDIDWKKETHILVACSTWGDGEMPDNAAAFWEWLKSDQAPSLSHASFAVLGLGDRNYRRFCQSGKNLDTRLAELGAKRLRPLCECDVDFETKAKEWMNAVSGVIDGEKEMPAVGASLVVAPTAGISESENSGNKIGDPVGAPTRGTPTGSDVVRFNRKNPFPAALLENRPLNARGSSKDTRHLSFSLVGSDLEYKVGDALGVFPRNDYDLVDRITLRLNCSGNEKVSFSWGEEGTLRAALLEKLGLQTASPALLEVLLRGSRNPGERRRLEKMLAEPDGEETAAYLHERDVLDVLEDFSKSNPDPSGIIGALGRLSPRLYSIASSPLAHPGEVHLCVGVVRRQAGGRLRRGVASTFLAERVPLGLPVPAYIQPSAHFALPEKPGIPIIMVGPGTGIAPFRAFLEERKEGGDPGKNWLFFGDQHRATDFLYDGELNAMHKSGVLTRLDLAFSRDQEEKVYVQDRMLEQSKELFAWLEQGAHFYVCGDAKRMAKDVDAALHRIVSQEGGLGEDKAREYIERLKREKRYARDVY